MQETLFKQWQDLNQISLNWYRDTSEPQAAAINDWMGLQSDPGAWAKLAKSSLESFRSLSDLGESKLSDLWQAQIGRLDLDGVAASIRELGGIQTSACTALCETQVGILRLYTDTTAQYLDLLKQAKGVEDLIATQAHIVTGVQDKLKSYSLDCLQIAELVKTAMSAWAERALDTAVPQDERAAPVSVPRRISKKTDPSAQTGGLWTGYTPRPSGPPGTVTPRPPEAEARRSGGRIG